MERYIETTLNDIVSEKGISISFMAAKTGISKNVLYSSLRGNRKLRGDEFIKVCDFVGVDAMSFCKRRPSVQAAPPQH